MPDRAIANDRLHHRVRSVLITKSLGLQDHSSMSYPNPNQSLHADNMLLILCKCVIFSPTAVQTWQLISGSDRRSWRNDALSSKGVGVQFPATAVK